MTFNPSEATRAEDLVSLFNSIFAASHSTLLVAGGDEPYYKPRVSKGSSLFVASPGKDLFPSKEACNEIVFRYDYPSSALHEIAHWTIAGRGRRQLPDYGYWYAPDGRSPDEQMAFEKFEARPQALEWMFSVAALVPFHVSFDNLTARAGDDFTFKRRVLNEVKRMWVEGMPPRASQFLAALQRRFETSGSSRAYWQKVLRENILPP